MDILAHMLWTNAGGKGLNKIIEKKEKPTPQLNLAGATFFGVFPDLFAFSIPFIVGIGSYLLYGGNFFDIRHSGSFAIAPTLYNYSHSLVIWAVVFIAVWIFYKRPRFELLGWALHILIDIPSHAGGFYLTPFLFPLSEYKFTHGVSWGNPWYMMINYSLLLIIYGGFLIHSYRKSLSVK